MKILHLSSVNKWGGGEEHIENLCEELNASQHQITNIIFCVKDSEFHNKLKKSNFNYTAASLLYKIDLRFIFKLGKFCKKNKIDLIHIHDPSAILIAIICDYLFNLPPFVFSKKTSFPIKNRKKTLFKYNYHKIKKIICVSKKTMEITSKSIEDKHKLVTIYNGTYTQNKSINTDLDLRRKFKLSKDDWIVGNIANHIRAKSLDTLIDVCDHLVNVKNKRNIKIFQIGSFSEFTENYLKRVKELNLESNLFFLGFIDNASGVIPQFDVSLMTSQSEGMPQFIYESMYFKTPVVSTNVGGISEVITHNVNGFLADIYNHKQLSDYVIKILDDTEVTRKFVEINYNLINSKFTNLNMANETLSVYREVLSE